MPLATTIAGAEALKGQGSFSACVWDREPDEHLEAQRDLVI